MPIFKLSAPKTLRLLSGHILPRAMHQISPTAIYIWKSFPKEKPPDPCLHGQGMKKKGGEAGIVSSGNGVPKVILTVGTVFPGTQ